MADFITLPQTLYKKATTSNENNTLDVLVSACSAAIEKCCRRKFGQTAYDELYSGNGGRHPRPNCSQNHQQCPRQASHTDPPSHTTGPIRTWTPTNGGVRIAFRIGKIRRPRKTAATAGARKERRRWFAAAFRSGWIPPGFHVLAMCFFGIVASSALMAFKACPESVCNASTISAA